MKASILVGVTTFFILFSILTLPLLQKLVISTLAAILYFCITNLISKNYLEARILKVQISRKNEFIIIFVIILLSLATYIHSLFTNGQLFLDWPLLEPIQYIEALLSILSVYFLSGYLFLRAFFEDDLNFCELISFSFVASMFLSGLIAFITYILKIDFSLAPAFLHLLNILLLLKIIHSKSSPRKKHLAFNIPISWHSITVIVLSVTIFFPVLFTQTTFVSVPRGDAWRMLARGVMIARNQNIIQDIDYVSYPLRYPYWYPLTLALLFKSSPTPYMNDFILLVSVISSLLPIFSYAFSQSILKDKRLSVVTTVVLTLFSGFGWIYYVNDKLNAGLLQKYILDVPSDLEVRKDIWEVNIMNGAKVLHDIHYPLNRLFEPGRPWTLCFLLLITLFYLLLKDNISSKFRGVLFAITYATLYLTHIEEALYIPMVGLTAFILLTNNISEARKIIYSYIFAVIFIAIIDAISPVHIYFLQNLPASIVIITSIVLLPLLSINFVRNLKSKMLALINVFKRRSVKMSLIILAAYFYGLATVVLLTYGISNWQEAEYNFWYLGVIPWYYLPLILGFYIPLTLLSTIYFVDSKNRFPSLDKIKYLLVVFILTIIFGKLISLTNTFFATGTREFRTLSLVGITLAPSTTLGIFLIKDSVFRKFKKLKPLSFVIILIVLITGSLSTFIAAESWIFRTGPWGEYQTLDNHDLSALNYLLQNSSSDIRISAPTELSTQIVSLSGLQSIVSLETDAPYPSIFHFNYPETVFLFSSDIGYLYKSPRDDQFMETREKPALWHMLNYLPIVYSDHHTNIYFLPFYPPPINSSLLFIKPFKYTNRTLLPLLIISLSGKTYDIASISDSNIFKETKVLVFPTDITKINILELSFNSSSPRYYELRTSSAEILSYSPLSVKSNNSKGNHDLIIHLKSNIDLTIYRYAIVEWKSEDAELYFYPRGSRIYPASEYGFIHTKLGQQPSWKGTLIDMYDLYDFVAQEHASMKGDKLKDMIFRVFKPNATFSIKKITFISDVNTYYGANLPEKELKDFISEGGIILVFGGDKEGVFSSIANITLGDSIFINGINAPNSYVELDNIKVNKINFYDSSRSTILATYTWNEVGQIPFILKYNVSKGAIIYVNLPLTYDEDTVKKIINTAATLLTEYVFSDFKNNCWIARYPLNYRWISQISMNGLGNIAFDGNINITAESMDLKSLVITNASLLLPSGNNYYRVYGKIMHVKGYAFDFYFLSKNVTLDAYQSEGVYSKVILANASFIIIIPKEQLIKISIINDSSTLVVNSSSSPIVINADIIEVLLKRPLIKTSGSTYLFNAELRGEHTAIWNAIIKGKTTMRAYSADNGNFYTLEFSYSGLLKKKIAPAIGFKEYSWKRSEWNLPWYGILTSKLCILYNVGVLLLILFYILFKHRIKIRVV